MNPKILKFAQFLAKRPTDRTIAMLRIAVGLIIIGIAYLARENYMVDFPGITSDNEMYFEYGIMALGLLPVLGGLSRLCLFKHKTLKKLQIAMGILMICIGFPIMDPIIPTATEINNIAQETVELGAQADIQKLPSNPGWIIGLLGFLPLFMGITGKGTYSHCLKYKEKITKIRV